MLRMISWYLLCFFPIPHSSCLFYVICFSSDNYVSHLSTHCFAFMLCFCSSHFCPALLCYVALFWRLLVMALEEFTGFIFIVDDLSVLRLWFAQDPFCCCLSTPVVFLFHNERDCPTSSVQNTIWSLAFEMMFMMMMIMVLISPPTPPPPKSMDDSGIGSIALPLIFTPVYSVRHRAQLLAPTILVDLLLPLSCLLVYLLSSLLSYPVIDCNRCDVEILSWPMAWQLVPFQSNHWKINTFMVIYTTWLWDGIHSCNSNSH